MPLPLYLNQDMISLWVIDVMEDGKDNYYRVDRGWNGIIESVSHTHPMPTYLALNYQDNNQHNTHYRDIHHVLVLMASVSLSSPSSSPSMPWQLPGWWEVKPLWPQKWPLHKDGVFEFSSSAWSLMKTIPLNSILCCLFLRNLHCIRSILCRKRRNYAIEFLLLNPKA